MTDAKFTKGPWEWVDGMLVAPMRGITLARGVEWYNGDHRANALVIVAAPALYEACADASFYLKSLGARLAALNLDTTETYGVLKTASMFAQHLDAVLAKAASSQTDDTPHEVAAQDETETR